MVHIFKVLCPTPPNWDIPTMPMKLKISGFIGYAQVF